MPSSFNFLSSPLLSRTPSLVTWRYQYQVFAPKLYVPYSPSIHTSYPAKNLTTIQIYRRRNLQFRQYKGIPHNKRSNLVCRSPRWHSKLHASLPHVLYLPLSLPQRRPHNRRHQRPPPQHNLQRSHRPRRLPNQCPGSKSPTSPSPGSRSTPGSTGAKRVYFQLRVGQGSQRCSGGEYDAEDWQLC